MIDDFEFVWNESYKIIFQIKSLETKPYSLILKQKLYR